MQIQLPSNPEVARKILEKGLRYSAYTPTLTNVTAPASLVGMYQLCGKVCFVSIKLDYTGISPTWSATPYITLPFYVSAVVSGMAEPPLTIYNVTDRAVLNYALFDTSDRGRISLPTSGAAIDKVYIISGFYWVD
jgi:hypothetical protein